MVEVLVVYIVGSKVLNIVEKFFSIFGELVFEYG